MILSQIYIFAVSIAGGVAAALLYDILRVRRRNFRSGAILLHIEDFAYWILASLILIIAAYISNDGEIRGFTILGYIAGIILYTLLLSKIVLDSLSLVVRLLVKGLKIIFLIVAFPFVTIVKFLFKILSKLGIPVGKAAGFISGASSRLRAWGSIRRKIIRNMRSYI